MPGLSLLWLPLWLACIARLSSAEGMRGSSAYATSASGRIARGYNTYSYLLKLMRDAMPVQVVVRVRPPLPRELAEERNFVDVTHVDEDNGGLVVSLQGVVRAPLTQP